MKNTLRRRLVQSLAFLPWSATPFAEEPTTPTIAAASDLKFALEEIAAQFEKNTGQKLRLVFGSSGNFYAQIMNGAPFHLFLSADESFVFRLASARKTEDTGRVYAKGRIGIFIPPSSSLQADGQLRDLAQAIKDGRLKKFAIANPEHAPYGQRAKEALTYAGLWDSIQPNLVIAENISQAAQFATSGSTQGGIVAQSLALSPSIGKLGKFELIPESWHQPLIQRMVVMKNAPESVKAFYAYLAQDAAKNILARYGFV